VALVDIERAADLYAQGRTLRQIGAELGVCRTTVSEQLRQAGVTMRRGGPPTHPASTDQILELRDPPRISLVHRISLADCYKAA
jgi:hypothetical protein